ncbi:M23 family metallopeptidase [Nocardioides sp.]|uniref:M23 family metallopeptidase n=1 Tax=Nocardioides sp. TaxID=35761 RepID=UPI002ED943D1
MSPRLCALPGTVLALVLLSLATLVAGGASAAPAAPADPVGVWPLVPQPEVVDGFDPPADPWGRGHRGVDLLGSPGQSVRAALPGRITWAGVLAGRGVVVVDHGTTRTTYEPVDPSLAVGTVVAAGDRIGRLSASGSHCPPRACLHWGWILGGGLEGETYLDPLRLVGAGPVRLLPLWRDEPAGGAVTPPLWRAPALPYAGWVAPLDLLFGLGLDS